MSARKDFGDDAWACEQCNAWNPPGVMVCKACDTGEASTMSEAKVRIWRREAGKADRLYTDIGLYQVDIVGPGVDYHARAETPAEALFLAAEDWHTDTVCFGSAAHLYAAAPDLYEALEFARSLVARWLHTQGNSPKFHQDMMEKIDAALSKARGER